MRVIFGVQRDRKKEKWQIVYSLEFQDVPFKLELELVWIMESRII